MRTKVLELNENFGKEYAGRYVFQEISWAKRNRIIQKHTKYSELTGNVVNSDYVAVQAETIWASLKEQPQNRPVTLEKLLDEENGVPIALGEVFSQVVNRLNSLSIFETRFLSEQSEDKDLTQHSQNSASARNSAGHPVNLQSSHPKPSNSSSSYSAN